MKQMITDEELVSCLENIKSEVQGIEALNQGQVIFMNLEGFFTFANDLSRQQTGRESNLPHLLALIEDYIPMTVSDKQLEIYLHAALSGHADMAGQMNRYINKVSKISFLNAVYQARSGPEWQNILQICRMARDIKAAEQHTHQQGAHGSYFSPLQ